MARHLEFHFTPKHGSGRNMIERELSVLARQCLDRRLEIKAAMTAAVGPREAERNRAGVRHVRSLRVADDRRKLAHLYPATSSAEDRQRFAFLQPSKLYFSDDLSSAPPRDIANART